MKNILLIVAVVLSQALSAQSKELVEFVESLELGNVDIEYTYLFDESNPEAFIYNVDLPMVLEGVKPFKKKRHGAMRLFYYRYGDYTLAYAKWRRTKNTNLIVFKE